MAVADAHILYAHWEGYRMALEAAGAKVENFDFSVNLSPVNRCEPWTAVIVHEGQRTKLRGWCWPDEDDELGIYCGTFWREKPDLLAEFGNRLISGDGVSVFRERL